MNLLQTYYLNSKLVNVLIFYFQLFVFISAFQQVPSKLDSQIKSSYGQSSRLLDCDVCRKLVQSFKNVSSCHCYQVYTDYYYYREWKRQPEESLKVAMLTGKKVNSESTRIRKYVL